MRIIGCTIVLLFFSQITFSQTEAIRDLSFTKDKIQQNLKKETSNFYYLADTLTIPIVDDFSTDKFKKYNAKVADSNVKDTLIYKFYKGGIAIKNTEFATDTTYYTKYEIVGTDTVKTKMPYPNQTIAQVNFLVYPTSSSDFSVWSKNTVIDTVWLSKSDTVLSTKLISQDSVKWYIVAADKPNSKIWLDNFTYITRDFAVRPPSIGAVVFEGLNENGLPYDTIFDKYGLADYLTSKPINISSIPLTEDLFFSFFYQPQGLGANNPDLKDSLILEFRTGSTKWKQAWFALGSIITDFKKVSIILGSEYYKKDFQFRFKNYATLSGNLDVWLVDYIKLAKDKELNDVAFVEKNTSFLKDYTSVPWSHYKTSPQPLRDDLLFKVKNNFASSSKNVKFDASIFEKEISIFEFIENNLQVTANTYFNTTLKHSAFTTFPTNLNDSSEFEIMSFISSGIDEIPSNDSVRHIQKFYNYYAYDDGSSETGYGLENSIDGLVAYKFTTLKEDTLRAISMYFNQSLNNNKNVEFDLLVWTDLNSEPVLRQSVKTKYFGINNYATYKLDKPILLSSTFYIGWQQKNKTYLNVGFDRNDTLVGKLFFKTSTNWSSSNIAGALMMRPIFGSDFVLGNNEITENVKFKIYPNPTTGKLFVESNTIEIEQILIFDVVGNLLKSFTINDNIDVSEFSKGMYFMQITGGGKGSVQKFILH